ncbi:molybdenum ABC transporter ATP-binding protein ModC [Vibrio sp.]|uniref:molybdenum ABC transporter ATP-binding protein ModC n=1 Tax=Vibrio sp. TaxID=678 RepID=UPI003D0A3AB9
MSNLTIRYQQQLGDTQFNIDLELPATGITVVFGRSGAGKTSLINVVAGLQKPEQGLVRLNNTEIFNSQSGVNLPVHKRNVGYVFQEARLFPHYKVRGNLTYGIKSGDSAFFDKVVSLLALEPLLNRYPRELSGGEKQRVAIGRALLSKPDVLLMDEPLASLDMPRKREVMPFLENLVREIAIPILYVTHSLNEVLRLADHIIVLEQGIVVAQGRLEEVWSQEVMRPWQSFSAQSSLFDAHIIEHNIAYGLTKVSLCENTSLWIQKIDANEAERIRLQIRASDVSIVLHPSKQSSIRNVLPATVVKIERQVSGNYKHSVSVKLQLCSDCVLTATVTQWAVDELGLAEGMAVFAQIKGVSVAQKDVVLAH